MLESDFELPVPKNLNNTYIETIRFSENPQVKDRIINFPGTITLQEVN